MIFVSTVRSRPCPAGSCTPSLHSTVGGKNVEPRSINEPSYVSCSRTCAGEFDVPAATNRMESTGASTNTNFKGEFDVRVLTVKAPPVESEVLEYRPIWLSMKLGHARW